MNKDLGRGIVTHLAAGCMFAAATLHAVAQEPAAPPRPGMVVYGEVWQDNAPCRLADPPQQLVLQAGPDTKIPTPLHQACNGRTMYTAFVPAPAPVATAGTPSRVTFGTFAGAALAPAQPPVDWVACSVVRRDLLGNSVLPPPPAIVTASATRNLDHWTLTCSLSWTPADATAPAPKLLVRWFAILRRPAADTDRSFPDLRTGDASIAGLTIDGASFPNVAALAQGVLTPQPATPPAADGTLAGSQALTADKALAADAIRYLEVQVCSVDATGRQSVMIQRIVLHSVAQADM